MPGSPRLFNFCRELSKKHEILLISGCKSRERLEGFLGDPCSRTVFREITILPEPRGSTWWSVHRHRFHLAPYFITKYRYPEYYGSIRRIIRKKVEENQSVDVVYVADLVMTQYIGEDVNVPAVLDLGDCKTLLFERAIRIEKRVLRKVALRLEKRSISECEKSVRKTFALIVMTSQVDESYMKKLAPGTPTLAITNGVDSEYFFPANERVNPNHLIFTGVMSYGPNEDAVIYFCKEIFPLIKKACPSVQFWVVGEKPSSRIQGVGNEWDVHVTGMVDDVRPYVQSAGIFVSPLRYGTGIKNKILAAMAMQKPVVATSMSLDGIDAHPGQEVLVADSPAEFAGDVCRLLKDEKLARRLGEKGHKLVVEKYSWKSRADLLEAALEGVVTGKGWRKGKGGLSPEASNLNDARMG
jgi:glycosyltransferase involved in cell wall biosynthesis